MDSDLKTMLGMIVLFWCQSSLYELSHDKMIMTDCLVGFCLFLVSCLGRHSTYVCVWFFFSQFFFS